MTQSCQCSSPFSCTTHEYGFKCTQVHAENRIKGWHTQVQKTRVQNTEGHKLPPKPELTPDRLDKLFSKLDFSGMEEWPEDVQQQVVELFKNYHHIFALTDLKLGCTSKIKHEIKLDNETPFKDHYHSYPSPSI